eukprot:267549_1
MHAINQHRDICTHAVWCCRECYLIFADRKTLSEHQKQFNHRKHKVKSKVTHHNKVHDQSVYSCDYPSCNKAFYTRATRNKHRKIHIKKYRCCYGECNRRFATKMDHKIHQRRHSQLRCEVCKHCSASFGDPAALRKHIKYIHRSGGITPFVCKQCKKQFVRKDSLQKHWQTHVAAKKRTMYYCDECGASFTSKSNCQRHKHKYH